MGVTAFAIDNGVDILRVHDIEATYKLKRILKRMNQQIPVNNSIYN